MKLGKRKIQLVVTPKKCTPTKNQRYFGTVAITDKSVMGSREFPDG